MKLILKILKGVAITLTALVVIVALVMVRPNVSRESLEDTYFLEQSAYHLSTIETLEGEDISISLHYQDWGDEADPVVVLIHGSFSSSHTFIPWAEVLVEAGYRVIMPDMPYFGLSEGFEDKISSFRRSAAAIKDLLDTLAITSFDLAGNSLGGAVSWYFASEYPTMVKSLTLIDALLPGNGDDGRPDTSFLREQPLLTSILSTFSPRFLLKSVLSSAYGDPTKLTEDDVTRYYDILRKEGTREAILTVTDEAVVGLPYLDRIASLTMPVFIMWGESDTWIPVSVADAFQELLSIPDDHMMIYEGVGHVPMEEHPTQSVQDFITWIT